MRVTRLKSCAGYKSEVAYVLMVLCLGALTCSLCGCVVLDTVEFLRLEKPPSYERILESYRQIELKESSSADVLTTIHLPEYELLSQSKSVVASSGQKKKGYMRWFNMVAFDENELTARRKYCFIVDEKPKILFTQSWWTGWTGLWFDSEVVLESKLLDAPYANENARRIAILRKVLENFREDISEVGLDNKVLKTSGMMVNQAFETVLVKLDAEPGSPALARRLSEQSGLEFEHISLKKGRIRMVVVDDIARVKIRLGSFVKKRIGGER